MRRVKIILILLFMVTCRFKVHTSLPTSPEEDLDLETELKLINKPPIKSIQTEYGHIVDCIDINKQLAFDHPLLKDHKIQMKPRFPHKKTKVNGYGGSSSPFRTSKVGLHRDLCPDGTVPFRRTTKQDLIGAKFFSRKNRAFPGSHYALLYVPKESENPYTGVDGIINVYNPIVEKDQVSMAPIWVRNGGDNTNTILAGWQVAPQIYNGETHTHLFAQWTKDTFRQTGCFNTLCPGFVQVDKGIYLGAPLRPVSTVGGPQYEFPLSILQDQDNMSWWVVYDDINVGYYPAKLFPNLSTADQVGWGGMVSGPVDSSPEMGSGRLPGSASGRGCFMRKLTYTDQNQNTVQPNATAAWHVEAPNCYGLKYYGFWNPQFECTLEFGGPGGNCGV